MAKFQFFSIQKGKQLKILNYFGCGSPKHSKDNYQMFVLSETHPDCCFGMIILRLKFYNCQISTPWPVFWTLALHLPNHPQIFQIQYLYIELHMFFFIYFIKLKSLKMIPCSFFSPFTYPFVINNQSNQATIPIFLTSTMPPMNLQPQFANLAVNLGKPTQNLISKKNQERTKNDNSAQGERQENKSNLKQRKKQLQNNNKKKENPTEKKTYGNEKKSKMYMTEKAIYRNKKLQKEIISVRRNQKLKTRKFIQKQINKEKKSQNSERKGKHLNLKGFLKSKKKSKREKRKLFWEGHEKDLEIPNLEIGKVKFYQKMAALRQNLLKRKFE